MSSSAKETRYRQIHTRPVLASSVVACVAERLALIEGHRAHCVYVHIYAVPQQTVLCATTATRLSKLEAELDQVMNASLRVEGASGGGESSGNYMPNQDICADIVPNYRLR